jgi:hypothetical protein
VVVVSEVNEGRHRSAAAYADAVVAPGDLYETVLDLTGGLGASLSIDAVGSDSTRRESIRVLEPGGTAVWLGMHDQDATIPAFDLVVREQRVQGAFAVFHELGGRLERAGRVPRAAGLAHAPRDRHHRLGCRVVCDEAEQRLVRERQVHGEQHDCAVVAAACAQCRGAGHERRQRAGTRIVVDHGVDRAAARPHFEHGIAHGRQLDTTFDVVLGQVGQDAAQRKSADADYTDPQRLIHEARP